MRTSPHLGMGESTQCVPAVRMRRLSRRERESTSQKRRQVVAVCRPASHSMSMRGHWRLPNTLRPPAPLPCHRLLHNQNKAQICVSCFACAFLSCWAFHSNSRCFYAACCVSHASPALGVTHTHTRTGVAWLSVFI